MRRTATLSLEGFDPDVIEAAREVAQRAGVPLETWIASVVAPEKPPAKSASVRQRARAPAREVVAREPQTTDQAPTDATAAVAAAPEAAPITPPKPKAVKASPEVAKAPAPAAQKAEPAAATVAEMMRRLDALDRSLNEERGAQQVEPAAEARINHVADRLAEIERRMGDLSAQIGGPRPLGRRGRPIAAEMREAVDEVRRRQRELDAAGPAEPAGSRIAAEMSAPTPAIAELQAETARLREILGGLATGRDVGALEEAMRSLSSDVQRSRDPAEPIETMRRQVEGLAEEFADTVHSRLETFGESLHQPAAASAEIASMHALLHGLAEKVERVGTGSGNLDALENQVLTLAQRLDTRGADPAVASLERTMGELLAQVASMRDDGAVEAAVERATRRAIADSLTDGRAPGSARIDAFRADLDDLRARQISADQRMQVTMDGLNTVLSRLVDRLGISDAAGPVLRAAMPEETAPLGEQLRGSTTLGQPKIETIAVSAPRSRVARRPEPAMDTGGLGDELLEPGSSRPPQPRPTAGEASAAGDIKTNFIAAARRAAQAAQADIAAETPAAPERRDAPRPRAAAPAATGFVGRLLGGIDKRRRPLILGLAAVVLALGAYQAYEMHFATGEAEPAASSVATGKPVASEAPAAEVAAAPGTSAAPSAAPAAPASGPQTTQSIAEAGPAKAAPAARLEESAPSPSAPVQAAIPKVATMASLGRELASVPTGLAGLKQSALDGDGAAIYELAAREADGRGMPRDLAVAAKLYEKLADAGYAPAQFKLGSFYEKGSGVIRDLGQAKSWYGRAADRGNIRAMHNLAVLHAENPSVGGKPDFATASSWFRRAAEYGVRDSQYNLAVLYARGLGVGQDLIQSYAWFSAAATQGDEEAGKKRDDVAAKLSAKDLASAKALVAAYKPKLADPSANDLPPAKPAPAAMSLLGAPPPGSPASSFSPSAPRTGV